MLIHANTTPSILFLPLLLRLVVLDPVTSVVLVSNGETGDPEIIRAITETTVSSYSNHMEKTQPLHLPDSSLGETYVVGHGQNRGTSDKVPSPDIVGLNQRLTKSPFSQLSTLLMQSLENRLTIQVEAD